MTLSHLLHDYAAFNTWANAEISGWLGAKPEDLLNRETPSSFPTLRETLLHIWGAQEIWLTRLQGQTPAAFRSKTFTGTTSELFNGLMSSSRDLELFLQQQDDAFFNRNTAYQQSGGAAFDNRNSDIVLHCLQHSTFHRGQIVTMARSLGLTDPPKTDYIHFVRQR